MTVHLGKHYTGKYKGFADTESGVFWEVLPRLDHDAARLQQALLKSIGNTVIVRMPVSRVSRYVKLLTN